MQWVLESQLASRVAKEERMNRVLLTGRLTRDPEMRVVTNGKDVTQSNKDFATAGPRLLHDLGRVGQSRRRR
jgi:hypothetical protein